jgi:hypothetical protein
MKLNLIEELEDLLSLCKDDERITLKTALAQVKRIRSYDDADTVDVAALADNYAMYLASGIVRREWPDDVLNYEAYVLHGNVMGSGADLPGTARPTRLTNREEYSNATVYDVVEEDGNGD